MNPILSMEEVKALFPAGVTKDKLAQHYGLTTFDTAIPQKLFDALADNDFDPWGHFVYDYSTFSFGTLFPLTAEGRERFEAVFKRAWEDPRICV